LEYEEISNNINSNLNRKKILSSWLGSSNHNRFIMFFRIMDNKSYYNLNNIYILREVTVKIGLERTDIQEGVIVETLLDSSIMLWLKS